MPQTAKPTRIYTYLALLTLILLTFALRVYRLDGQSMWGDELWSLQHVTSPDVRVVLAGIRADGTAPPGYYLCLHLWRQHAGTSTFALRYLSVIWGTLSASAIFVLGQRLGGRRLGLLAALIHALSPFLIYYSQEARAYIQATCFSLLASYLFIRLWQGRQQFFVWLGYVVTGLLAAGSHYFAWPILLAHGLFWVGDYSWHLVMQRRRKATRAALYCLSAQLSILLLYLPWVNYVYARVMGISGGAARMTTPLAVIIPRLLEDFSITTPIITAPQTTVVQWRWLLPFLLLLLGAFLYPRRRTGLVPLLTWLIIPLLSIFYISFPTWPGWSRYFITLSPYYYLLLARGVEGYADLSARPWSKQRAPQVRALTMLLLISAPLFLQARALQRYHTDPQYARWDYRGQVILMAEAARRDTALVFNGLDFVPLPLSYYMPADQSWRILPQDCTPEREPTYQEIAAIAAQHEYVWLVQINPHACDKEELVYRWLNEYTHRTHEFWMENYLFSHYFAPGDALDTVTLTPAVRFGEAFTLEAYALNRAQLTPGETLAVSLLWRPHAPLDVDYKFFLALLTPDEQVLALRDGMPGNWSRPTTQWQPEELVTDRWGMELAPDAPAGVYTLYVGAYHPATGDRLPLQTASGENLGDMLPLTEIEITR